MDSESCTRAFSQARVYLEQIRNRVTPGVADVHGTGKRDYLVDAAKQIRLALERDVSEDYEEAFNHYKNGVDVLLNGIQADPNKERREAVKRKITQYLKRAEEIFNCHLQRTLGNGSSTETGYSSLRFRPIRTLSTPVENLKRCKVVGIIDKVQLVQDPVIGGTFILKRGSQQLQPLLLPGSTEEWHDHLHDCLYTTSLLKSHVETRERQTIIPHGIPFMAKLLHYYVSEDSIFLHLEHVKGGTLWSHLRSQPHFQHNPSGCSTTLSPKLSLAVGHMNEDGSIGNPHDSNSRPRCNLHSENSAGQISVCVNRHLLKSSHPSLSWKQSPDHIRARPVTDSRWHIEPATSPQGDVGIKDLSVTHSGATESSYKLTGQGHNHLANQGMTFLSCDSSTTINGIGNLSHNGTPQQERRLQAGERCSQSSTPVPKATRRCNMSKTESPDHQMPRVAHSPPALPGQRQMSLGSFLQNDCRHENEWGMAKMRDGRLVQEQHKKQPSPGQYDSPVHWSFQMNGLQAWHISEDQIRLWAAELLLALEGLHQQGVLCQDLNPRNLLLDSTGHICLTYFGQWTEVEPQCCNQALEDLYCAPEVGGISELTEACDWWSFGALLYELLSGTSLSQNHPSGIHPHTQLYLPEQLSQSASSLLSELLMYNPKERLGCGKGGRDRIKSHSFFSTIQWNKLVSY